MAETTTATAGRPREFDEDEVLDRLVELFWTEGFESASLADIVAAAGLNKSSIYNAFGSKNELFYRVLDRYLDQRRGFLMSHVAEGGLDVVLGLIEMMRLDVTAVVPGRGCLAVNSTTELGLRDDQAKEVAKKYRSMMREALEPALHHAAEHGEIRPELVDVYADTMLSLAVGIAVASRGGASNDELNRLADSMALLVQSWRVD